MQSYLTLACSRAVPGTPDILTLAGSVGVASSLFGVPLYCFRTLGVYNVIIDIKLVNIVSGA